MKGNFRSSLEWRNDKKGKKEEKKIADDDGNEGQEESVQSTDRPDCGKNIQIFPSVQLF